MRKNSISAKMKKILAVACASALVLTSVPANYAFATETNITEEEQQEENNNQQPDGNGNQQPDGNGNQQTDGNDNQQPDGNDDQQSGGNDNQQTGGNGDQQPDGNNNQQPDGNGDQQSGGNNNQNNDDNEQQVTYSATISADPEQGVYVGDSITFTVSVLDGNNTSVQEYEAEWQINNGTAITGKETTFTTDKAGTVEATVSIKIGETEVASAAKTVTVNAYAAELKLPEGSNNKIKGGETTTLSLQVKNANNEDVNLEDGSVFWSINGGEPPFANGTNYAFTAPTDPSKAGKYSITASTKVGNSNITETIDVYVLPTYDVRYFDNLKNETPRKVVEDYVIDVNSEVKPALLSNSDADCENGDYTFVGWCTKDSLNAEGRIIYHCDEDGNWYTESGAEFKGFESNAGKTVNLYAIWADNAKPTIDIKTKELQYSNNPNGVKYTQANVTVSDTESGIASIYYAVLPAGENEPGNDISSPGSIWTPVIFGKDENNNDIKEEYEFTVDLPSKGVLWVLATDNSELKATSNDEHALEFEEGPNIGGPEKGFSLVFENTPPVINPTDITFNNTDKVSITAKDLPEAGFSGIKSIDYTITGRYTNAHSGNTKTVEIAKSVKVQDSPEELSDITDSFTATIAVDTKNWDKKYSDVVVTAQATDFCGNKSLLTNKVIYTNTTKPTITVNLENTDGDDNFINCSGDKLSINIQSVSGIDKTNSRITFKPEEGKERVFVISDPVPAVDSETEYNYEIILGKKLFSDGKYGIEVDIKDSKGNEQTEFAFTIKNGSEAIDAHEIVVDTAAPEAVISYTFDETEASYLYTDEVSEDDYTQGTVYTNIKPDVKISLTEDNIPDGNGSNKFTIVRNKNVESLATAEYTDNDNSTDGSYFYKIYGKDKAGNALKVTESFAGSIKTIDDSVVNLSSEKVDAPEAYAASIRIVLDQTAPEAVISYTFKAEASYLYTDEVSEDDYTQGTVYTNIKPDVKISLTEDNIPDGNGSNKFTIVRNKNVESLATAEYTDNDNSTDGSYFYKIYGKDKAGNALKVTESFAGSIKTIDDSVVNLSSEKVDAAEAYAASIRIVLDQNAPEATVTYCLPNFDSYVYVNETNESNYIKGTVYTRSNPTVTITLNENNALEDASLSKSIKVSKYTGGAENTVLLSKEGYRERIKEDNSYFYKVYGTDKAGNGVKVTEEFKLTESFKLSTPDGQVYNAEITSYTSKVKDDAKANYRLVRDTVSPYAEFTANKPNSNGGLVKKDILLGLITIHSEWRSYFNKGDNSIGTPKFTITDTNLDLNKENKRIKAGYITKTDEPYSDVEINEWGTPVSMGELSGEAPIEFSIEGSSLADGVYRFTIEGTDKAGNLIIQNPNRTESDSDTKGANELTVVKEGQKEIGLWTSYKIIDSKAPALSLFVGEGESSDGSISNVFYQVENDDLKTYTPFRRVKKAFGSIESEDASETYVSYVVDSTVNASDKDFVGKYANNASSGFSTVNAEQIFRVINVKAEDRAGNVTNLRDGSDDYLYLDVTRPANDNIKPRVSFTRKSTPSITTRMGEGGTSVDLYNKSVSLQLNVFDPDKNNSSSGLKQVKVSTTMDGATVNGGDFTFNVGFKGDDGSKKGISPSELNYEWSKVINFPAGNFQSNNIVITVEAIDNSGNVADTKKYNFGIDTTGPNVTVIFDNNSVQNGRYFKANRTATIQITDRNIDWSMININTQGAVSGGSVSRQGGNGENDVWTKTVSYTQDGDYTLSISGTDALGNSFRGLDYSGGGRNAAPTAFTIDKTNPVISVTFDNNDAQNGKYYKDPRIATVSIREHNFRESDVNIAQTADIQQGSVSAPGVGGFGGGGDDHSASINYSQDGNYTIEVNYTDLAGNPAEVVRIGEFVIDQTPPTLKFIIPDETKGLSQIFQGDIAPQIEFGDINMTRGMATIELKGMKGNSDVLKLLEDTFANYKGTVRYENLRKVRESDDIYTATAVVTDLAGNRVEKTITFSVNRFGSTYDYNRDDFTTKLMGYYFTNSPKDVILREINVNQLTEHKLTLYKDGDNWTLTEGKDYSFEEKLVNGHYEYIYTIFAKNFEEEGNYNIIATSKDKAANTNSNSTVKENDGSNEVPLRFAVDKTPPTNLITGVDMSKNKFTESQIVLNIEPQDNMNAVARFRVRVLDRKGNVLQEFEISGKELAEYFEENNGIYQLTVNQNTGWQTIEVLTTDAAGNESVDYSIENNTAYRVLVTPNLFYQYIYRLPLVGATLAIIGGLVFFWLWKRKKDEEEKEAA